MPLIPALGRQRRRISEFEASLVYRVSSRTARATQRNPVSKNITKQQKTCIVFWGFFCFFFFFLKIFKWEEKQ